MSNPIGVSGHWAAAPRGYRVVAISAVWSDRQLVAIRTARTARTSRTSWTSRPTWLSNRMHFNRSACRLRIHCK